MFHRLAIVSLMIVMVSCATFHSNPHDGVFVTAHPERGVK